MRYLEAARDAGLRRAVVRRATIARSAPRCWARPPAQARVDGVVAEQLQLQGKPHPDTFLEGGAGWASSPRRRGLEDALAGVEASRRRLRLRGRVDRVGSATPCWSTAPTSWSRTSRSCCAHRSLLHRRAVGVGRTACSWTSSRVGVGVRALQRVIGLRGTSTRRSRTRCPARTSTGTTDAPIALRRGGLGYPEDGQIRQRHERQLIQLLVDDRRSTSATARSCRTRARSTCAPEC